MAAKKTSKKTSAKTTKPVKSAKAPKAPAKSPKADGKMSQLDAAVKLLSEADGPMTSKAMVEAMGIKGYWTSPGGKTPHATLYAAIIREINVKGDAARFVKVDRGQFALSMGAAPAPTIKSATAKKAVMKAGEQAAMAELTEPGE
jgi:hypothetical protein